MHSCHPPFRPHPKPPRPVPPEGYLLQKIIACEKRSFPCLCREWCFDNACESCIQSVSVCGSPSWQLANGCTLHVSLPLTIRLCDRCGGCRSQDSSLEVETELSPSFVNELNNTQNTLLILPCVQLLRSENACGGCFRVQLGVSLKICLLQYEICRCGAPKPQCPQLPLYPPPMC